MLQTGSLRGGDAQPPWGAFSRVQAGTWKKRSLPPLSPTRPNPPRSCWSGWAQAFESFTSTQQEANRKLDALQEMLGDFLSLHLAREDAFSKGVEEIKRALIRLPSRATPRTDTPTSRRITVRNVNGGRSDYIVQSGTDASKPAKDDLPPESLLKMPLVIRSQTGDYLGIAGKGEGSFCLHDFSTMHRKAFPAPHGFTESWSRAGGRMGVGAGAGGRHPPFQV